LLGGLWGLDAPWFGAGTGAGVGPCRAVADARAAETSCGGCSDKGVIAVAVGMASFASAPGLGFGRRVPSWTLEEEEAAVSKYGLGSAVAVASALALSGPRNGRGILTL